MDARSRSTIVGTTFEGKTSGNGPGETGQIAQQEQNQNVDLPQQKTLLCQTVQNLGEGFAAQSLRRQDDYNKMERTMTTQMEEGFKNEQQDR